MISAKALPVVSRERPATCHNFPVSPSQCRSLPEAIQFCVHKKSQQCKLIIQQEKGKGSPTHRAIWHTIVVGSMVFAIAVFFATECAHLVVVRFHIKILPHHLIHNSHRHLCRRLRRIDS